MRIKILCLLLFFLAVTVMACSCTLTTLGTQEAAKYDVIFKGKVLTVRECGDRSGEAVFEVHELYKGKATSEFPVLFWCNDACYKGFRPGEEWVIYSNYRQLNNVGMDWCSRSRKYFDNDKEDFYTSTYGNDYYDEVKWLRENLGQHRVLKNAGNAAEQRNKLPDVKQSIIILICSLLVVILFYVLFRRFFR